MESHIDAFALNIAYGWPNNYDALSLAFEAAAISGFKLFFSFLTTLGMVHGLSAT